MITNEQLRICARVCYAGVVPDFIKERESLVENYIAPAVKDKRVVQAFLKVPRHKFVPAEMQTQAYEDRPLPIGQDQTISQPSLVAQMTEAIQPKPEDKVLEIGTGSGYQAAILAQLASEVYTIERLPTLAETAQQTLKSLGCQNVFVKVGDGTQGWPEAAPFDGILVTAAAPQIPQPLIDQLKEGGRIVIPAGSEWWGQTLKLGIKTKAGLEVKDLLPVRFVPLIGQHGWRE